MHGDRGTSHLLDDRIRRLPPDGGAFVRALHSLARDLILEIDPRLVGVTDFASLLAAFVRSRGAAGTTPEARALVSRIRAEHATVEHAAVERDANGEAGIGVEETRAAAHNFLRFCALAGIDSAGLDDLRGRLSTWNRPGPGLDGAATGGAVGSEAARAADAALQELEADIDAAQEGNAALLAQTEAWVRDKHRLAELEGETMRLAAERDREEGRGSAGDARADVLRRELERVSQEARAVSARLDDYRDLDRYVHQLSRFSLYTRTRMDYERSVMTLTPEQAEAVKGIRPGFDFLIRGAAGTGKTIVLLHALDRFQREQEGELELLPGAPVLFFTYTTTLVKYDRYIAGILRGRDPAKRILTADSFFLGRIRRLGTRQRVDYGIVSRLAEKHNDTGFLTDQELAVEIEEFIFGGLVTRREYLEERIPRRGMRLPLSPAQREAVWSARDRMVEEMEHDGVLSKNYSRMVLIEHLVSGPDTGMRDLDVAFVDESQDLSAADLKALKLMTRRGLVLAGDTGQSIYGVGSPYRRAGVDIAGRSRVLHTSFRNTIPIHDLAEAYRRQSRLEDEEAEATVAFRDGPAPELYLAPTRQELARLLLRKAALFMDRLGYDPENLTVLAPTRNDLATVGDMLGHAGYRHADIRDDDFSFAEEKTVRLSTLHSSKGLDFPVVLLYLPSLPVRTDHDEKTGDLLARNLIYVAMTRAMDNLNVFTLEGEHEGQQQEPLQDLVRILRARQRR